MDAVPTWPLRVAAQAAQVPEKTTSRWRNNDVITLGGNDVTTTGTGNHCGWSRKPVSASRIRMRTKAALAAYKVENDRQ